MKRKLINKLLDWKELSFRKPILLTGGRGVGKTYLVYDFAKSFYTESIYMNFEREPFLYDVLFKNNPSEIENVMKDYFHLSDSTEPILIILDEVTNCPDIKYILNLLQNKPRNHIIAISSTFNIDYKTDNIFYHLKLFPLDFEEFLIATGNEWYIEVITVHYKADTKIPDIVHQELLTLFELYIEIGGMPLAVNEYNNIGSIINVSEQHRILLNSFLSEVYKNNVEGNFLKISQVFNTIAKQLMKENRKFQYKLIRKGATQALYSDALKYIKNTGYGICCYKLGDEPADGFYNNYNKPSFTLFPTILKDYTHMNFKLYLLDSGLLNSTLKTQYAVIKEQYRRGLIENYVAQCLTANGYSLYFWESDSKAKIDFIINKDRRIIPIEVRTGDNTRSRNVSIFRSKFQSVTDSIKISTRNFEYINHTKYVPVYAVFCI
ncbi:MAG: AAA family ATPase [Anaerocolumna sp.]